MQGLFRTTGAREALTHGCACLRGGDGDGQWVSMGHQFTKRCGILTSMTDHDYCPIFYQWLDCVYQLLQQAPTAFEFNEEFLLQIVDQLWSCRYGVTPISLSHLSLSLSSCACITFLRSLFRTLVFFSFVVS